MWSDESVTRTDYGEGDDVPELRDIHPLTPGSHVSRSHRRDDWEGGGSLDSIRSTMTRELNAMVVSGSNAQQNGSSQYGNDSSNGGGEEPGEETAAAAETNPLAIVPTDPIPSPGHQSPHAGAGEDEGGVGEERLPPVHVVRREEVESKVAAWQTAEVAKINNRYKREEVIINGWESEQVEKAAAWLKKIERKLDKQKARATETMQNEIAKAQQKAAEKKASAEAKRGTKAARVLELANFMRAVGRAPSKRSFF